MAALLAVLAVLAVLAALPAAPCHAQQIRRTRPTGGISATGANRDAPRMLTHTHPTTLASTAMEDGPTLVARMLGGAAFGGPECSSSSTLAVVGVGSTVRLIELAVPSRPAELARSPDLSLHDRGPTVAGAPARRPSTTNDRATADAVVGTTASVGALGAVSGPCPADVAAGADGNGVVALAGIGARVVVLRRQGSMLEPSSLTIWDTITADRALLASRISDGFTCGGPTEMFLVAANPAAAAAGTPDANATGKIVLIGLGSPGSAFRVLGVLELEGGATAVDARPARCNLSTGTVQVLATQSTGLLAATITVVGDGATFTTAGPTLPTPTPNDGTCCYSVYTDPVLGSAAVSFAVPACPYVIVPLFLDLVHAD